jgi:hypothetical protein
MSFPQVLAARVMPPKKGWLEAAHTAAGAGAGWA